MGGSLSTTGSASLVSRCDGGQVTPKLDKTSIPIGKETMDGPPPMRKVLTVEDKIYAKFKKEPLVPIGCAATAYFLVSGIKSFQNQDPRRGQKMMRLRVGAQFATLAMFVFYVGLDNINFEIAPQYQRALKEKEEEELQTQGKE